MRGWIAALLVALSGAALAEADYAHEKRWADEFTPAIIVGDVIALRLPSGRTFAAIYAPHPNSKAGVIVVHGLGVHPDWGLINPLRSGLAEQGYTTLSVQMPVLAADARGDRYPPLFPEAAERLAAAVALLRAKGSARVAIVSHSMGARMTNYFLNHAPDPQVDAWVAIGISGLFTEPGTLRVPVLDLFGERDLPEVLENARLRADALRALRGSAQVQVAGADHFFQGQETELVRQVRQFLDAKFR